MGDDGKLKRQSMDPVLLGEAVRLSQDRTMINFIHRKTRARLYFAPTAPKQGTRRRIHHV